MEKVYTKEEYAKAYTELIEILKNIPKEEFNKVPKEIIKNYIKDMDNNYKYEYDTSLEFDKQEVSHLTKILIANLYIQYWATAEEKQQIKEKDRKQLYELEQIKKEKYDTNKLFENKIKQNVIQHQELIVIKEKNILQKIIDKVKGLIRRKSDLT